VEKVCRAKQASDDNLIRHMRFYMQDKEGCRHTLEMCDNYCFSRATVVTRSRPKITPVRTLSVSLVHFWVILISGCCRDVNEIFALLGCFAALISSKLPTFGKTYRVLYSNLKGLLGQFTLRNTPECRRY
jgi:hypothetical protein